MGGAEAPAVICQNEFAVPVVDSPDEQRVIDTGPYGVIRHPMCTGFLMLFSGMALWLQSWAGFAAVAGAILILTARIAVEEATLRKTLPGYDDYARRVRKRLIAFIV